MSQIILNEASKKELQELQPEHINITRELEIIQNKLNLYNREKKKGELSKKEIESLPSDIPIYQSIGKMFLKFDEKESITYLDKQSNKMCDEINKLEGKKNYLQQKRTSLEENIAEILKRNTQNLKI